MDERRRNVNFTIVPDDDSTLARVYTNFCSIQNSPFDFTLSFCEMLPLGEQQIQEAQATPLRQGAGARTDGGPGPDGPRPDRGPAGELPPVPGVLRPPQGPGN